MSVDLVCYFLIFSSTSVTARRFSSSRGLWRKLVALLEPQFSFLLWLFSMKVSSICARNSTTMPTNWNLPKIRKEVHRIWGILPSQFGEFSDMACNCWKAQLQVQFLIRRSFTIVALLLLKTSKGNFILQWDKNRRCSNALNISVAPWIDDHLKSVERRSYVS